MGSKDGARRVGFQRTLVVAVEAERRRMLGDENWKKFA